MHERITTGIQNACRRRNTGTSAVLQNVVAASSRIVNISGEHMEVLVVIRCSTTGGLRKHAWYGLAVSGVKLSGKGAEVLRDGKRTVRGFSSD